MKPRQGGEAGREGRAYGRAYPQRQSEGSEHVRWGISLVMYGSIRQPYWCFVASRSMPLKEAASR